MIELQENVPLAPCTTIQLGGTARYFTECRNADELRAALRLAQSKGMPSHILGGGSNTIFPDEGFDGLVVRVVPRGVRAHRNREEVVMVVAAGEPWDDFVRLCINSHLAGVECLSGIPGLAGATPMQNVGAYGQEVSETVVEVQTIDRQTLQSAAFAGNECGFGYRCSRFNTEDANRFVITEVSFRLRSFGAPALRYPELKQHIASHVDLGRLHDGREKLQAVRESVLALRRKKSMVMDETDPNSRSVGSFFKNPVVTAEMLESCKLRSGTAAIPFYPSGSHVKIPAAWLVENAGFHKGYRMGGVGVSTNHSLALVNINGTTRELLALADAIRTKVFDQFGIMLEREPVLVSPTNRKKIA
jgi:UDP-N-acetylmuramate dehydrogenase